MRQASDLVNEHQWTQMWNIKKNFFFTCEQYVKLKVTNQMLHTSKYKIIQI